MLIRSTIHFWCTLMAGALVATFPLWSVQFFIAAVFAVAIHFIFGITSEPQALNLAAKEMVNQIGYTEGEWTQLEFNADEKGNIMSVSLVEDERID